MRLARQQAMEQVRAQQKRAMDSARQARQQSLEATRQAQKKQLDSARAVRIRAADSMRVARQKVTDSLSAIRKHRESKFYKDSVLRARQTKMDSVKLVRQRAFDSMRLARKRVADSLFAFRKQKMDSLKTIQKRRSDSLAVIRKYRESKRFADSVAVVKRIKSDSLAAVRKAKSDSMISVRKQSLDSAAQVRKRFNDSVAGVRKKFSDSIAAVRKVRSDSLAKMKENRERLQKTLEKKNEDKMKLALELKIKKKREAWNNEKMLKKGWSLPRRVLQNTYTRYNYYFNADKKLDEALLNMQRMSKENYDSLLALFPFDPDRDSSKLSADMDSIIRKASVGIQIHDPRTKWADDLYLLLGQAYYYKGNYKEASTAFRYIIAMNQRRKLEEQKKAAAKKKKNIDKENSVLQKEKEGPIDFIKHRSVNNDAILWLARTYTEARKEDDAESILDLIEADKNLTDQLKGRIALEKAYLHLSRGEMEAAADNLVLVASDEHLPRWVKTRAAYLNGQLLYDQGSYDRAAAHFEMVIDFKPKIEMDFYARKNLAYSLIQQGGSQEEATASLRKMLNDGKYLQYNEQIYYVLGRLSANADKPEEAIAYMRKSIESSKSTRKQKALSFAGLGNAYYATGNYKAAKSAYDSAGVYGKSIAQDEEILLAARRSGVLDKVVAPLETIAAQDSLLALSYLSEREQRAAVRRYIRMLEKQREDSAFRAANGDQGPKVLEEVDPGGGGGNWYFASASQMQQGSNDFKRKWGTRPETDNWRRAGGATAAAGNSGGDAGGTNEGGGDTDEQGLPTEARLLAAIPTAPEQQQLAKDRIQQAYMELANAYVTDLEDYSSGRNTLDTLDRRYPDHKSKAEALYLRYQIALKQDRVNDAQLISEQLRKDFAETKWAQELTPKDDVDGLLAANMSVSNFYDETYGMMMQRQYINVLQRVRTGQQQYKDPVYIKRFRIMEAIALAGIGNFEQADTLLTEFVTTKPTDSLRNWADAVLSYVKKNKPVPSAKLDSLGATAAVPAGGGTPGATTSPGKAGAPTTVGASTALDTASAANAPTSPKVSGAGNIPASYTYKAGGEHFFMFYFKKLESKTMGVKAGLTDFNTFSFSSQKLSVNLEMLKEDLGFVVVKSFPSASHARIYLNAVRAQKQLFKEFKPEEFQLLLISTDNLKKLAVDKDLDAYLKFYKANYK